MAKGPKRKNSKEFTKKYKKKHVTMKTVLVIIAMFIIIVIMILGYYNLQNRANEYESQIEILSTEIKDLKDANSQLEDEKDQMDTSEYKEKVAREQLGMIGKDEYSLQESDDSESSSTTEKKD